jgi:hypothetical protein
MAEAAPVTDLLIDGGYDPEENAAEFSLRRHNKSGWPDPVISC